ncbi:MAG: hypothetical protein ABIR18_16300 [Chitinophagaceae bacterium]
MSKLTAVRIIHTLIWIFFNVMMSCVLYAVITGNITKWMWLALLAFAIEGIVLLLFRNTCPLTIIARRYSESSKANFDIYLPNWLAKNNKLIYTILLGIAIVLLMYRLAIK